MIIRRLIWDEWNIDHIGKHRVNPEEVEGVCLDSKILINRSDKSKMRVIGQTQTGRYITIFLGERGGGNFYPITARDCAPKEKRLFRKRFK